LWHVPNQDGLGLQLEFWLSAQSRMPFFESRRSVVAVIRPLIRFGTV
jgi:hypothetical protein